MSAGPLALIPVRAGEMSAAGLETASAIGGTPLLVGQTLGPAAAALAGIVEGVTLAESPTLQPGRLARSLSPHVGGFDHIVLPGTPDGRDLGARLAAQLGWAYVGTALEVGHRVALVPRHGGELMARRHLDGPFVATLQRGIVAVVTGSSETVTTSSIDLEVDGGGDLVDAIPLSIEGPDAETMDLAEAPRIIGGGAGMMHGDDIAAAFSTLVRAGAAVGASMGATRVVTDAGWVPHARQIGTTGVVVDPDLYMAFGISGAVQHTAGLGRPRHVVSVNTDPHCPMMAMADLAVVSDANETLAILERLLSGSPSGGGAE